MLNPIKSGQTTMLSRSVRYYRYMRAVEFYPNYLGQYLLIMVGCCLLLDACSGSLHKEPYDIYALHPVSGAPIDNDSYYVPPRRTSSMCNTIGAVPSCGGL